MKEYIDKATLVAAVKERLKYNGTRAELDRSAFMAGREKEDEDILTLLDTLEVKEVDLEKEIKCFTMSKELYEADSVIKAVAKHFYELGLNEQKNK